ncbi:MAG TPA: hypothetical protein VHZ55_15260 [Bryobacteraceae bacterium]|nr:hypothetical protein [Bryobacteraceae bacterium]
MTWKSARQVSRRVACIFMLTQAALFQMNSPILQLEATGLRSFSYRGATFKYNPKAARVRWQLRGADKSRVVPEELSDDMLALQLSRNPPNDDGLITPPKINNETPPLFLPLRISAGHDTKCSDSLSLSSRFMAPSASDQVTPTLRFASAGAGAERIAPDLFSFFARINPATLSWVDRRPIGSLILGTAATGWARNPRGWFLDSSLDVVTIAGRNAFHRRLLEWADHSIVILKAMNAQGMVTWDIEGEQFPHATTYIGDPRQAERLAPEMQGVIDEYFARFRRAGLRVGVTVRPQALIFSANGTAVYQSNWANAAQTLNEKIFYARKRWGATLFYIDSNGDEVLPLSFSVIKQVADANPDVLLIPEHKNAAYYSKTAPYCELRKGAASTPDLVRSIYPRSFSVINVADGPLDQNLEQLKQAVADGDILMFRAWFDDPLNAKIRGLLPRHFSAAFPFDHSIRGAVAAFY